MTGRIVRRGVVVVVAAVAAVAIGSAAVLYAAETYLRAPVQGDGVINLLLLGADEGPVIRGGNPLSARADGFHILSVSADGQHATFVNIPRDAYVAVPGQGRTKINACLVRGPENCVATVEQNFGIDIDNYLLTTFHGLKVATDRFGNVTVDVPRTLTDGGEDIAPGTHRINGAQALAFTRDRKHRPNGDFDRAHAQSTFLIAAHQQMIADGYDVARIAEVAGILQQTAITDIGPGQLLRLGYLAMTVPQENIENVTVPGNIGMAGAASVVRLPDSAYAIVRDAADDGQVGG